LIFHISSCQASENASSCTLETIAEVEAPKNQSHSFEILSTCGRDETACDVTIDDDITCREESPVAKCDSETSRVASDIRQHSESWENVPLGSEVKWNAKPVVKVLRSLVLLTRAAESEVKCPTPTFQNFRLLSIP